MPGTNIQELYHNPTKYDTPFAIGVPRHIGIHFEATFYIPIACQYHGSRIYKPDGSLVDVDVTQAYPISDGKNADSGKESKYKLAIPSLDVGDVIEYFYYNEEWSDIFTLKPLSMEVSMGYPVLKYKIDGRFAPNLTVEYRTLNGAPVLNRGVDEKNRNTVSISLSKPPPDNLAASNAV